MASNEDSLESYKIAQLHDRLMQSGDNFSSLELSQQQQQQQHHGLPRPRHSPNTSLPRLKPAESAPAMAMADDLPLPTPTFSQPSRPKSTFAVTPDCDGDTQPMPSQVYKDYARRSMMQSSIQSDIDPPASFNPFTQYTTQPEGTMSDGADLGHVDLLQHWPDTEEAPTYHEISSDQESDSQSNRHGGETQDLLSSVNRPNTIPKTPATAACKRNHRGEPVSAASTRTPGSGISAFGGLGNNATDMSATQIFQATQAASSPMQNHLRSDPVFTRPSPDFRNASSPLADFFESPTVYAPLPHGRATTEPRDVYLSLKESQDKRKHNLSHRSHSIAVQNTSDALLRSSPAPALEDKDRDHHVGNDECQDIEDQDDARDKDEEEEEEDSAQLRHARKQQHARLHNDALRSWDAVTAPGRRAKGSVSRTPTYGKHIPGVIFRRSASREAEAVDTADPLSPDLTSDPADEYDELAQEVRPSQRSSSRLRNGSGSPSRELQASAPHSLDEETNTHVEPDHVDFTVADSQPGRQDGQWHAPALDPSSLHSVVPGSQFPLDSTQVAEDQSIDTSILPEEDPGSKSIPQLESGSASEHISAPQTIQERHSSPPPLPGRHSSPVKAPLITATITTQTSAVLETDPPEREDELGHGSTQANANSTTFETAPTHQTASASGKAMLSQARSSRYDSESPRKAAGILRFADFATDPTPPDALDDADVDVNVLTEEDQSYLSAMNSSASEPVNKRLRIHGGRRKRVSLQQSRSPPPLPTPEPLVPPRITDEPAHVPVLQALPAKTSPIQTEAQATSDTSIQIEEHTPTRSLYEISEFTEPFPQESGRASPATNSISMTPSDPLRAPVRGKLTRLRNKLGTRAESKKTPRVSSTRDFEHEIAETPQARAMIAEAQPDMELSHSQERQSPTNRQSTSGSGDATDSTAAEQTEETGGTTKEAKFPRVFALFKGTGQAYYPATCLGYSTTDRSKLRVRFDDDTTTEILSGVVRRLELRPGDHVKVDLPGLRNKVYVVAGFPDDTHDTSSADQSSKPDIYGHAAVQITAKEKGSFLDGALPSTAAVRLTIPVTRIYLTHTMFVKFKGRDYIPPGDVGRSSRLETPTTEQRAPSTPGSRSRRGNPLTGNSTRSTIAPPLVFHDGIFAGMAFAVSYTENGAEKELVIKLIQQHGGLLVDQGFPELFDMSDLDDSPELETPSVTRHRPSPAPTEEGNTLSVDNLKLSVRAKSLGFVALIADAHSRRAKYIQALALSLPCLSGRWIIDSVAAGSPISWPRYLLPAGQSVFLSNAVRSRTLAPYDIKNADLAETLHNRDHLLRHGRVLLVGSSNKAIKWEARKTYAFLTVALGASSVRKVVDLEAAKYLLQEEEARAHGDQQTTWVYVEGSVADAEQILFGSVSEYKGRWQTTQSGASSGSTGKKRKRGGETMSTAASSFTSSSTSSSHPTTVSGSNAKKGVNNGKMVASKGNIKIVGDEFVVQSLILGSLLEE
ncbi:hypothetical protein AAFC00_006320 [Neodothiora populina]|uniref:BRCT domain-containing protein n=1 Tax=Neodothiora populina TaxID=2781224 RepID=A0ABR3P550_9PEZI